MTRGYDRVRLSSLRDGSEKRILIRIVEVSTLFTLASHDTQFGTIDSRNTTCYISYLNLKNFMTYGLPAISMRLLGLKGSESVDLSGPVALHVVAGMLGASSY